MSKIMKLMRIFTVCYLLLLVMFITGCATSAQKRIASAAENAYLGRGTNAVGFIGQDDEVTTIEWRGPIQLTLGTGSVFKIRNIKPLKSALPRNPTTAQKFIETGGSVVRAGLLGYFGVEGVKAAQRPPLVVRPDVVITEKLISSE